MRGWGGDHEHGWQQSYRDVRTLAPVRRGVGSGPGYCECLQYSGKARELSPESSSSTPTGSSVPEPGSTPAPPSGDLAGHPTGSPADQKKTGHDGGKGKPIPGQYIVTLNGGGNPRSVAAIAKVDPLYVYRARSSVRGQVEQGPLDALSHNKAVKSVEQDQAVTADAYTTQAINATTGQPWGIDRIDQRSSLSRSYTYWAKRCVGVRAYIIDTGIATADSDFGGRASVAYDAFGGNGQDCNGHGSHVAGIVGGSRYGVAKRVTLIGVRVLPCSGSGSNASVIAGIDWVRTHAIKPAVANISIGGGFNPAENTAVTNLVNSGVFVAVAAGNSNVDACTTSPSSAAGTLTVAATDWYDTKASYSNWGGCVDVYAPGTTSRATGSATDRTRSAGRRWRARTLRESRRCSRVTTAIKPRRRSYRGSSTRRRRTWCRATSVGHRTGFSI